MRIHAFAKQYAAQLQITVGHSQGSRHGEDSKVSSQFQITILRLDAQYLFVLIFQLNSL